MNQPKVFFDARHTIIGRKVHFGVSRYGSELVTAFAKIHPVTMIINDKRQLDLLPKNVPYVVLNGPMSPKELFIAHKLNKLGADVVFSPLQVMGNWFRKYKLILTMQDITYYKFHEAPSYLPLWVRVGWRLSFAAKWPQRIMLNSADRVATVSHTSKEEIQEMKLTKRHIDVIYNASDKPKRINRSENIKKELVFVGNLYMKYKNAETLIKAANLLPEYKLHLVSPINAKREKELKALAKHPEQLVFWHGAKESVMYKLLATATAAVHASKGEGFGLPIIEAMSMGTPVICTDMPVFHEVGGDAAIYCDPDSPEDYAVAVRKVQDNPRLAANMSKKGIAQAKKFSWDASAKQLLLAINLVTKNNK